MMAAHYEEFSLRCEKYQTCLILSPRPRKANFSPKSPRTREEAAEKTASRDSLLSSFLTVCSGPKMPSPYHAKLFAENSKFIITNGSKLKSTESSKTFKVEPSPVLSQVKDFLPKMRQAEEALEKELRMKSTADLDIEDVEDGVPYIEMNLALVEAEGYGTGDSLDESGDSECGDADEVQTQEIDFGHVTEKNFVISKTAKGHVKPIIEDITKEQKNGVKKNKRRTCCKRTKMKKKQR